MTDIPAVVYLKAHVPIPSLVNGFEDTCIEISEHSCFKMKQLRKRIKKTNFCDFKTEESHNNLKKLLAEFDKEITKRLSHIEERLDFMSDNCDAMEEKVEHISSFVDDSRTLLISSAVSPYSGSSEDSCGPSIPVTSGVTYITLNSQGDYPNGSWLGDESNPEIRVRCDISPTELFHINTTCTTAEKMALTLLDYLFDRETQAYSNISGTGKHKKKQLDPLLIYGIRCHLITYFGITDQDWNKIKQNIDSKCRTAFRRKIKGLPLVSKSHRANGNEDEEKVMRNFTVPNSADSDLTMSADEEIQGTNLTFQEYGSILDETVLERVIKEAKLIHTDEGDFQILHATAEQVAQIQKTHQIQLLTGGSILATPIQDGNSEILTSAKKNDQTDMKPQAASQQATIV